MHSTKAPSWLNEKYMTTHFRDYYKNPSVKVKAVSTTAGSKFGDNYLCQIVRIKSDMEVNGETKKKFAIAKIDFASGANDAMKEIDMFQVEADFFNLLLPNLMRTVDASRKFAPMCYWVDMDNKSIIMEDMMETNFFMQDRVKLLNKKQAFTVLTKLASLHGASYKVLQQDPSFKKKYEKFIFGSQYNPLFVEWFKNLQKSFALHGHKYGLTDEQNEKVRKTVKRLLDENFKICSFEEGKLNTLIHGDCWKNNMLFHATDGSVDDAILLDFQCVTYNSVAVDLNYFLFSSVSADVLADNLDQLLEHYYTELSMVSENIDGLSLKAVKDEFNERLFLGLALFLTVRPLTLGDMPCDSEAMLNGVIQDQGYVDMQFIYDIRKVFPLFDKLII